MTPTPTGEWTVHLRGGRQCPMTRVIDQLGGELLRPIDFGRGGPIMTERYHFTAVDMDARELVATYIGLERHELKTKFDPNRIPR